MGARDGVLGAISDGMMGVKCNYVLSMCKQLKPFLAVQVRH